MNELQSILAAWRQRACGWEEAVVATVVGVKGSAYRRPGARMLILPDGTRLGTISGGCLETDVARKAAWWTAHSEVALRSFDTSSEGVAWEFGLGCHGVISLLLERASSPSIDGLFRFLDHQLAGRRHSAVATLIRTDTPDAQPGDRLWCGEPANLAGTLRHGEWPARLAPALRQVLRDRRSCRWSAPGIECFLEHVAPPQRLFLLGAGHDAIPLVQMAHLLGWSCSVGDPRPAYARSHRFPGADRVTPLPARPEPEHLGDIDHETAVVFMTHHYDFDCAWLPAVLRRRPRYVGLLGPRRRAERMIAESGLSTSDLGPNLHAPIGLDLGGDHPEVVALSIVSEIQAALAGRKGGFLKDRPGSIHGPTPTLAAEFPAPEPDPTEARTPGFLSSQPWHEPLHA